MVPKRSSAVLALLACAASALAQPAPQCDKMLALDLSACAVTCDGKPSSEHALLPFECAYLRASIIDAEKRFDALPTRLAQEAYLGDVRLRADGAHNDYLDQLARLVKESDPAKVDALLGPVERAKKLEELDQAMWKKGQDIARPFLWPPREDDTYLRTTVGHWPKEWKPYLRDALWDRHRQIEDRIEAVRRSLVEANLAEQSAKTRKAVASGETGLSMLFDGAYAAGAEAAPAAAGAAAARRSGLTPASSPQPLDTPASLPIPQDEAARSKRDYFSRGTEAGLQRLKDDAQIALWHMAGKSRTVGDPYGKIALSFEQSGPSCSIAAQYQAMRARGKDVEMAALAKEALAKGYFIDYGLTSGERVGGTLDVDGLLRDHGVRSSILYNSDLSEIARSVAEAGDALINVRVKPFWDDPTEPDSAAHTVYVTGAEIGDDGQVLGLYVNDTGTGEAARFVSASVLAQSVYSWVDFMPLDIPLYKVRFDANLGLR